MKQIVRILFFTAMVFSVMVKNASSQDLVSLRIVYSTKIHSEIIFIVHNDSNEEISVPSLGINGSALFVRKMDGEVLRYSKIHAQMPEIKIPPGGDFRWQIEVKGLLRVFGILRENGIFELYWEIESSGEVRRSNQFIIENDTESEVDSR